MRQPWPLVIGIGLEDKSESVRDFMKAYEMSYPVLLAKTGDIELMQALGNSRAGLTLAIPVGQQNSVKLAWSKGVTARFGGDLETYSLTWQYLWFK